MVDVRSSSGVSAQEGDSHHPPQSPPLRNSSCLATPHNTTSSADTDQALSLIYQPFCPGSSSGTKMMELLGVLDGKLLVAPNCAAEQRLSDQPGTFHETRPGSPWPYGRVPEPSCSSVGEGLEPVEPGNLQPCVIRPEGSPWPLATLALLPGTSRGLA